MFKTILLVVLLSSGQLRAEEDAIKPDGGLKRKVESFLHLGYGATLTAAVVARKFRKIGIPLAATMSAATFGLRALRTFKAWQEAEGLSDKEMRHVKFDFWFSAAAIPLSVFGIVKGMSAIQGGGWRAVVPFVVPEGGSKIKSMMIGTSFLSSFALARWIDWNAHKKKGIDPLTSDNFAINTVYDLAGGTLTTLALNNAATFAGRLQSAGTMTLAYSLINVLTQEVQHVISNKEFSTANAYFDIFNGVTVSNPRNLLLWGVFHRLASKATGFSSAMLATIAWKAIKTVDRYDRRTWFVNSKLTYLSTDKTVWQSILTRKWSDYKVWESKKEEETKD